MTACRAADTDKVMERKVRLKTFPYLSPPSTQHRFRHYTFELLPANATCLGRVVKISHPAIAVVPLSAAHLSKSQSSMLVQCSTLVVVVVDRDPPHPGAWPRGLHADKRPCSDNYALVKNVFDVQTTQTRTRANNPFPLPGSCFFSRCLQVSCQPGSDALCEFYVLHPLTEAEGLSKHAVLRC